MNSLSLGAAVKSSGDSSQSVERAAISGDQHTQFPLWRRGVWDLHPGAPLRADGVSHVAGGSRWSSLDSCVRDGGNLHPHIDLSSWTGGLQATDSGRVLPSSRRTGDARYPRTWAGKLRVACD